MFMNDVNKKEEIRNAVIEDLRSLGIKYRTKKTRQNLQEQRRGTRVFGIHLHLLPTETVTLECGQQLVVPKIIHRLCSYILNRVNTEGIFRKEGSKSRQKEIKLSLNAGCSLGNEHHVIDIACILKTFFRELPEPLFPLNLHELFLRCTLLHENTLKAILLGCLLLPTENLNTLSYFMQFLQFVSQFSPENKMNAENLAIVLGPNLMPLENKTNSLTTQQQLSKVNILFKLLIENSIQIGILPESVVDRIAFLSASNDSLNDGDNISLKKKRRRRSGSLTRMFNGLIKMVGGNGGKSEEVGCDKVVIPDLLQTPKITKATKKRKIESVGISHKKKREVVNNLPQTTVLCTPYTPIKTPISRNPNPKNSPTPKSTQKLSPPNSKLLSTKPRKTRWSLGKSQKPKKDIKPSTSFSSHSSLVNWPSVAFKKIRKRHSDGVPSKPCSPNHEESSSGSSITSEPPVSRIPEEFIEIPRVEYEEIKNRISTIEKGLDVEIEALESAVRNTNLNGVANVQNEYEKVLATSENLSPTTDQLARRLSKELKIRRSSEHRVVRSPSARKIGSIRKRSETKLARAQTWNNEKRRVVLKRGKPNTFSTGLPHTDHVLPKYNVTEPYSNNIMPQISNKYEIPKVVRRSLPLDDKWTSGERFFGSSMNSSDFTSVESCRASIAKLRSQNAGMVMAKAKMFEIEDNSVPKVQVGKKIGSVRVVERQRVLKCNSPRRRACKTGQGNMKGSPTVNVRSIDKENVCVPRNVPQIKKNLVRRSPRKLNHAPVTHDVRKTPLKVVPLDF